MYFMMPKDDSENATYNELAGLISLDDFGRMVSSAKINCFVSEMKMNMIVSADVASDVYRLLLTGKCSFGLNGIRVYRIKTPIQVDDVEGKKHFQFRADLEFDIDTDAVDKNA